jgi:hypothetical protein
MLLGVIWEPFVLAVVLGLVVSAGLYFAYLWPSVEPLDEAPAQTPPAPEPAAEPETPPAKAEAS